MQAANRIRCRKPVDDRSGAVGRVVVDDDDLAVEAVRAKTRVERRDQAFDALGLIVRRNHDRELERGRAGVDVEAIVVMPACAPSGSGLR